MSSKKSKISLKSLKFEFLGRSHIGSSAGLSRRIFTIVMKKNLPEWNLKIMGTI